MTHEAPSARSKSIRIVKPAPVPASSALEERRPAFPDLVRSREGRVFSEARYRNGESFALALEELRFPDTCDLLSQTGIVAQMALSSHLLGVGGRTHVGAVKRGAVRLGLGGGRHIKK